MDLRAQAEGEECQARMGESGKGAFMITCKIFQLFHPSLEPFEFNLCSCGQSPLNEMGDQEDPRHERAHAVVKAWEKVPTLFKRAAAGKLANVGNIKNLVRSDVDSNYDLLAPIITNFGS